MERLGWWMDGWMIGLLACLLGLGVGHSLLLCVVYLEEGLNSRSAR